MIEFFRRKEVYGWLMVGAASIILGIGIGSLFSISVFLKPISEEFGYCYDQQNLGMSPEMSLQDLSRRTGILEVKIFVLAIIGIRNLIVCEQA